MSPQGSFKVVAPEYRNSSTAVWQIASRWLAAPSSLRASDFKDFLLPIKLKVSPGSLRASESQDCWLASRPWYLQGSPKVCGNARTHLELIRGPRAASEISQVVPSRASSCNVAPCCTTSSQVVQEFVPGRPRWSRVAPGRRTSPQVVPGSAWLFELCLGRHETEWDDP